MKLTFAQRINSYILYEIKVYRITAELSNRISTVSACARSVCGHCTTNVSEKRWLIRTNKNNKKKKIFFNHLHTASKY